MAEKFTEDQWKAVLPEPPEKKLPSMIMNFSTPEKEEEFNTWLKVCTWARRIRINSFFGSG